MTGSPDEPRTRVPRSSSASASIVDEDAATRRLAQPHAPRSREDPAEARTDRSASPSGDDETFADTSAEDEDLLAPPAPARERGSAPSRIGRYRVLGLLGAGGMGEVYACHDDKLDRRVAVKLLLRARDGGRLLREARGLARLSHPNVVAVYEVGEHEGAAFLAMELVEGQTLGTWLGAEGEARGHAEILAVLQQAGAGLEAAHAAGLVHRDFKPDNVVVGLDGRVRVLDFGLARGADGEAHEQAVTRPDAVVGTPHYMAVEQWSGEACTPATDQFAFCVVAYEALYGVRPFTADHFWQLPQRILDGALTPIPPERAASGRVHAAILRGLSSIPALRWPSLRALLNALDASTGHIDFSVERRRHEHFFGRSEILTQLDRQLAAWDRGWLLLTGGPGLGKSALLNRWLEQREAKARPTASHFIRRNYKNWFEPEAIQANLAAQLEELDPEQIDPDADPRYRLEQLLQRLGPAVLDRGERLVLLVDGLDEAMAVGADNPIPRIFPHELPAGVVVVATSRPVYPNLNWFSRRSEPTQIIDLDSHASSNEDAVREFWTTLGPEMDPPLTPTLERAAIERGHGNLMHAVKLHELWSKAGATRRADDVPEGLEGMLDELWERVQVLPKSTRRCVREGLGLLCAARESLPLYLIEELLDWDEGDGEDEFLPAARELVLEEQWHGRPAYRPFHEGLREFVERKLPRSVRRQQREFAEFAAWPPRGDEFQRRYALRHRVEHLIECGQVDAAFVTCVDVEYLAGKAQTLGVIEVERELRVTARAQSDADRRELLTRLSRVVGASAHWAQRVPAALATLLHDRVSTHAPRLLEQLRWPRLAPVYPHLRHPLQARGLGRILEGHQRAVEAVAALGEGWVVSGSKDRSLRIWDAETGEALTTLHGHEGGIRAVVVLADGRVVSGSDDKTLRVWDPDTGACLATLRGHQRAVTAVDVLPDGRLVSGSDDKTLRVWDLDSGASIATLRGHLMPVTAVAALADGRVVSASWDNTLRVWELESGATLATLRGHEYSVWAVAALSATRVVSGSLDNTLRVWDLDSGESLAVLEGHQDSVSAVAVLPDGRVVSGSRDHTLRVWDLDSGETLAVLHNHQDSISAVAVLPGGRIVSASSDNTLRAWDLDPSEAPAGIDGHQLRITALLRLGDGRLVSGSDDKTLRVWDPSTGAGIASLSGHFHSVTTLCRLGEGGLISGSADRCLRVWDLERGLSRELRLAHERSIFAVATLPGQRLVTVCDEAQLRIWALDSGEAIMILDAHEAAATCVLVLSDGRLVSGSEDATLRVWDLGGDAGPSSIVLAGHEGPIRALAALASGQLVSGSDDHTLRVWDPNTGEALATLRGHQRPITAVAVLADGRVASSSDDRTVRLWALESGRTVATVYGDAAFCSLAAVDDELLAAGDGAGNLWFIELGGRPV